jgi:hypothetical protein
MNMITAGFNFHTEEQGEGDGLTSHSDLCTLLQKEVLLLSNSQPPEWPACLVRHCISLASSFLAQLLA